MRPSGSGKPSSARPWPRSCGGAGAARWAAAGMWMRHRYRRRIRWTWLGGLGPWAKAGWQSGMRAASNRIVPLRASTAVPSRAARRIRRQYPGNAEAALARTQALMARLGLEVNTAKTRIARLPEEAFDFLGYTIGRFHGKDGRAYIGTRPS